MTEARALIERLREYRPTDEWGDGVRHAICDEAAARIERLEAALREIAENDSDGLHMYTPQAMQAIARKALEDV